MTDRTPTCTRVLFTIAAWTCAAVLASAPAAATMSPDNDPSRALPPESLSPTDLLGELSKTGLHEQPREFDHPSLHGTWYCFTLQAAGDNVAYFGDPDYFALCQQWINANTNCYIRWTAGQWDGLFQCVIY